MSLTICRHKWVCCGELSAWWDLSGWSERLQMSVYTWLHRSGLWHRLVLNGVERYIYYTIQLWVYEIQECLFLYSVYWFMAFTIKMPLSVNICLCFNLSLTSSTLVLVHPIVSGVWLGPLGLGQTLDLSQTRHNYWYK